MDVSCKKFNMLLCSHSKGLRKQGPGSSRTLKIAKFGFSHAGGLYRAGFPVKWLSLAIPKHGSPI